MAIRLGQKQLQNRGTRSSVRIMVLRSLGSLPTAGRHRLPYTPKAMLAMSLPTLEKSDVSPDMPPAIVRGLTVVGRGRDESKDYLVIEINGLGYPLWIKADIDLGIGDKPISAVDYFRRVIEPDDRIDIVSAAVQSVPDAVLIDKYWIEIRYVGTPRERGSMGRFKEDGMFAMRTKAGEKAERRAARVLVERYGHQFSKQLSESPGCFQIYYEGKRDRKVDRVCLACGMQVEVKKRNTDQHFRVSHSALRPFKTENSPDGWHAFVFADLRPRFVPNTQIFEALANGQYRQGGDKYDEYAQIFPTAIQVVEPPMCPRSTINNLRPIELD